MKKLGYAVDRKGFGVVRISEKDIHGAVAYFNNAAEFASLYLVPEVIKRGIKNEDHVNHKGRNGVDTITFGAPVIINGKRGNMGVVVKLTKNYYKTHRILMPDGTRFIFENEKPEPTHVGGVATRSNSLAQPSNSDFNINVAEADETVKRSIKDNTDKFSLKEPVEETDSLKENLLFECELLNIVSASLFFC